MSLHLVSHATIICRAASITPQDSTSSIALLVAPLSKASGARDVLASSMVPPVSIAAASTQHGAVPLLPGGKRFSLLPVPVRARRTAASTAAKAAAASHGASARKGSAGGNGATATGPITAAGLLHSDLAAAAAAARRVAGAAGLPGGDSALLGARGALSYVGQVSTSFLASASSMFARREQQAQQQRRYQQQQS